MTVDEIPLEQLMGADKQGVEAVPLLHFLGLHPV